MFALINRPTVEGRVPVRYLTDAGPEKFLASTSDTEPTPAFASLPRDLVSMPHPPIGGPATRELGFGELGSNRCDSSSPGLRTPEGTGGGGVAWRGVAWRGVAWRGGAAGL